MKKIWIFVFVGIGIVVGTLFVLANHTCWLGGNFDYYNNNCITFEKYGNLDADVVAQSALNEVEGWKIYRNEEYGFKITFTDAWKGYEVELQPMSSNFGAGTVIFKLPTTKNYGDGSGYAEPLKIYVYSYEYWDKLQKEEGSKPGLLGKNSDSVFAY